jgi:hypothetical protein
MIAIGIEALSVSDGWRFKVFLVLPVERDPSPKGAMFVLQVRRGSGYERAT